MDIGTSDKYNYNTRFQYCHNTLLLATFHQPPAKYFVDEDIVKLADQVHLSNHATSQGR
jgi:hypothetical protein